MAQMSKFSNRNIGHYHSIMWISQVSVVKLGEFHGMIYQNLLVLTNMKPEKAVGTSTEGFSLLVLVLLLLCSTNISSAIDTITVKDSIKDGESIISSGGNFEMGFFSPCNSNNRYVGIWYKKISSRTVVWVANRETPLTNATGALRVLSPGILVLSNDTNDVIWSTNTSRPVQNPIVQLLDSGNLVVRDASDDNPDNFLWQSFHYPTDTLLPDMQLGKNYETGREVHLSSWKSRDDPAPGDFIYQCDPTGYPQNVLRKGHVVQYRAGPWNGLRFSGAQNSRKNSIYSFGLVFNDKEVYFYYHLISSVISRFVLNQSGVAQRWTWVDRTQEWILYLTAPNDNCDSYALCGPYGTCRIGNSPVCGCLDKFVPKYPSNWVMGDWSSGCTRNKNLDCPSGDGFLKYSGIKLPDTRNSWYNRNMTLEGCRLMCLKNCSCMAYANADVRNGGSGCLLWFDDLIDIRGITEGQDIYIRVASSELDSSRKTKKQILRVSLSVVTATILLGLCLAVYFHIKKKKKKKKDLNLKIDGRQIQDPRKGYNNQSRRNSLELPFFDLVTVLKATDSFSQENKLGEGGFGPVYKGALPQGQEIAVKRLSETSTQGLDEFKNEVTCIVKLQHRNLVRLLGCCIEGEEKMLIYEYMHNKSLDLFIFDEAKSKLLDWQTRFQIIIGIARGIMYLHQDSRLRIIHRDLKASNVLLDIDMNPKISDFGMARSFRENDAGFNTKRVVGTYGYMSPEYQVDGIFSVKSDVFSYGVLILEIVSGKRNRGYFHPDHHHNLLGHAWKLYIEDRSKELIDENFATSCNLFEVLRTIHVGLLCVQQFPDDRPNMSAVVMMLSNEGILPCPKQPGFFTERNVLNIEGSSSSQIANSGNDITITLLDPR